ncbi:hypothetical protein [Fibrobacter sp. UWB12]|uniref:hypothetical protein n=1 Tax=Fibrobacter sp. UWB12 TaxID=1896203 RepID=UPI0009189547|nr:hypothetical protein [Fibrobacter sp. UWB12]SHK39366.1 hypothetical protein SAMN05720759_102264 [Fibrobacter sp. UWB12]
MNIKTLILCACIAVVPALAGKIVTYTATSTVSQEDANNSAMAGVAKQIKSQVSATQTLTKYEDINDGKSVLGETYRSKSNVKSNVVLKGVKVVPVKVDKGFKATATLDMDEFTASLQFRLKTLQQDITKLEKSARKAIDSRTYANAASDLEKAQDEVNEYNFYLQQLADVYPLNDSHRLEHTLPEIEKILVERLSNLTISTTTEPKFELTKAEMPSWNVIVKDSIGPVPNFPLIARQSKTLSERRTQKNGIATFKLRNVNFEKGPYVITVEPNLSLELLKKTGLRNALEVPYSVKISRCEIKLACDLASNACSALENALSKKSIFVTDDEESTAPELSVEIENTFRGRLGFISSFDFTIAIKGDMINFFTTGKGVGKNEAAATISAIKKTDFAPLQKQLKPLCK